MSNKKEENNVKDGQIPEEQNENPQIIEENAQKDKDSYEKKEEKGPENFRALVDSLSPEELEAMVKKSRERDFFLESLQRVTADYINYQKRMEKEQESYRRYALSELLKEILGVADYFEKAIQIADKTPEKTQDFKAFLDGIILVEKELWKTLDKTGVKPIEALGKKFDPLYHDAIRQENSSNYPDMTVIEEYQKGYKFHDRVLLHSKVAVSRNLKKNDEVTTPASDSSESIPPKEEK